MPPQDMEILGPQELFIANFHSYGFNFRTHGNSMGTSPVHLPQGYRYKKTGVMLAHLVSEEEYQPSLFHAPVKGRIDIDKIVDDINRRMGDNRTPAITRASQGTANCGGRWKMKAERHSPNYTTNWNELPVARI